MSLPSGSQLGPYTITNPLGAGGMGEVYRARDSRLGCDVAIKVLPSSSSADADRLQRFEQEARAAAALNHPNILALYDIVAVTPDRIWSPSCSRARRCAHRSSGVRCRLARRSSRPCRSRADLRPRTTKGSSIAI